jgi:hypothetical protein
MRHYGGALLENSNVQTTSRDEVQNAPRTIDLSVKSIDAVHRGLVFRTGDACARGTVKPLSQQAPADAGKEE